MAMTFGLFARHAELQLLGAVHAEHADSGAADIRFPDDVDSLPAEMLVPVLLARVKERGQSIGLGINSSEIGTFVQIAVDAGEAKV